MSNSHDAPPEFLDRPIEVGPDDWQGRAFYFLMNALVVPRPIGWISTLSANGVRNLAPYSHFNLMGSNPFYCAFASTGGALAFDICGCTSCHTRSGAARSLSCSIMRPRSR